MMAELQNQDRSVSRRRSLFVWGVCCALAGVVFLSYALTARTAGRGEYVLPLDDVYIHFQYARQLANGQPYVYNPGLPPTSGATSFLYPYLLAVGDTLGFRGLNLGVWALGLGALALAASLWLLYQIGREFDLSEGLAPGIVAIFALTGAVAWHFMSGMETGFAVLFVLLTLRAFAARRLRLCIVGATLLALTRPEGGILTAITVLTVFLSRGDFSRARQVSPLYHFFCLLLPLLAIEVQPVVNLLATGSLMASGSTAKSLFGIVPPYPDVIAGRILDNFLRMWAEFFTGVSPREGLYFPLGISVLALIGWVHLLRDSRRRPVALLILAWLLAGTLAVATLDTAFWHFKRYQMPLLVLLFPLAARGLGWVSSIRVGAQRAAPLRVVVLGITAFLIIAALWTGGQFVRYFAVNVSYVYLQPLQMARWLNANTSPDVVVAVHDVGMIRYIGERTTLDMVGLTTPGAADYWRSGPGAVAEFLLRERPDYIASYGRGHGLGLGMLAETSLYANELTAFPVILDNNLNVALAADYQGIYQPDWTAADRASEVSQTSIWQYIGWFHLADSVNVADLDSEKAHDYNWHDSTRLPGFPTEVFEQDYLNCAIESCRVVDGGRRIDGEESFTLDTRPGEDVILVTRLHPHDAGTFTVYANDKLTDTRWIPPIPGQWLEVPTLIPAGDVTEQTRIRIVPHTPGGHYMPYYHWAYQGRRDRRYFSEQPEITYQDGAIALGGHSLSEEVHETGTRNLVLNLWWQTDGSAQGDYSVFVHVLNDAGEIVAQHDARPGGGTLPPGNWLPGTFLDTIVINLSQTPAGTYQVVLGLYDPENPQERLMPSSGDPTGHVFIGEIEVKS